MLAHSPTYFSQEKDYSCGPAVMRMALARFGEYVSERTLRKLMKPGFLFGTRHHRFSEAARTYGLYAHTKTKAALEDVEQALHAERIVIVNFVEPVASASHFALIVALEDERVILDDPWHGKGFPMDRKEFVQRWQHRNRFGKGNWYRSWMLELSDTPFAN
jgi:predicted double-glycine peptidase